MLKDFEPINIVFALTIVFIKVPLLPALTLSIFTIIHAMIYPMITDKNV